MALGFLRSWCCASFLLPALASLRHERERPGESERNLDRGAVYLVWAVLSSSSRGGSVWPSETVSDWLVSVPGRRVLEPFFLVCSR